MAPFLLYFSLLFLYIALSAQVFMHGMYFPQPIVSKVRSLIQRAAKSVRCAVQIVMFSNNDTALTIEIQSSIDIQNGTVVKSEEE